MARVHLAFSGSGVHRHNSDTSVCFGIPLSHFIRGHGHLRQHIVGVWYGAFEKGSCGGGDGGCWKSLLRYAYHRTRECIFKIVNRNWINRALAPVLGRIFVCV